MRIIERYLTVKNVLTFTLLSFIYVGLASRWVEDSGDVAHHQRAQWRLSQSTLISSQQRAEFTLEEIAMRAEGPLAADDANAVRLLRAQYLHPPEEDLPYNLKEEADIHLSYTKYKRIYPSWAFIDGILKDLYQGLPPGFFVEAGALDGEFLSNTLQLERRQEWTGLLIEAERESYLALRGKHRKAWTSPACLATKPYPHTVVLTTYTRPGKTDDWLERGAARIQENPATGGEGPGYRTFQKAQCFPALTFFLAMNVTRVDFFSLDVEGVEMNVLRSFPFDQVTVDVWAIEHTGRPKNTTKASPHYNKIQNGAVPSDSDLSEAVWTFEDPEFISFMEGRGYYLFDMFCHPIPDYVFVRRDSEVFRRLKVPKDLWQRRGICLHKAVWNEKSVIFLPKLHRDKRHWPNIQFSG